MLIASSGLKRVLKVHQAFQGSVVRRFSESLKYTIYTEVVPEKVVWSI